MQGKQAGSRSELEARINTCLWFFMRRNEVNFHAGNYGDTNFRENATIHLGQSRLSNLVQNVLPQRLLPHELFKWITKDKRQINWILKYENEILGCGIHPDVPNLFGRELAIANLDQWEIDLVQKEIAFRAMERAWNDHLQNDNIFKWFKKESEASRCEFAWEWLVTKWPLYTAGKPPVSNYSELLVAFDGIPTSHAQKTLDVGGIRSSWNQQKGRARKKEAGVSQYNFWLSDQTISDLDNLAATYGVSRPQIIAALIQSEAQNNRYLPEKVRPAF